jgi:ABC-type multidrug transport system fused ATPase/permease subunit
MIRSVVDHKIHSGIVYRIKTDLLERIMNAPVSFFDKTPKDVIMRRFNGNVGQVCGLIWRVSYISSEMIRIATTLFFVVKMNFYAALGIIPFVIICNHTLSGSNTARNEMCRCMEAIEREVGINQGEIMSGGATIRAAGSQDFAKKINE